MAFINTDNPYQPNAAHTFDPVTMLTDCCGVPVGEGGKESIGFCSVCGQDVDPRDDDSSSSGATFAESKVPQIGEPYMVREFPPAAQTLKQAAGLGAIIVALLIFWGLS
jgi:hypothetical protein